jgi:hypothetical protein
MRELGYRAFFVRDDALVEIHDPSDETEGDWIFRPSS